MVDDNLSNRKLFHRFLTRLVCDVATAEDGLEAVQLAEKNNYDVIFMDGETMAFAIDCDRVLKVYLFVVVMLGCPVHMPVMDGYEATRRIVALPREKRPYIVAVTADVLASTRAKCLESGTVGLVDAWISFLWFIGSREDERGGFGRSTS